MYIRTPAQRLELWNTFVHHNVFRRMTFKTFRRSTWISLDLVVMVQLPYILLGIERDGYTHS